MSQRVLYHINEQQADALIGPIHAELRELEHRAQHYIDHIRMGGDDRELVESTLRTLRTAREEVEGLYRASTAQQ